MQRLARRRAVFGGILAGGVAAPLAAVPAGAATSTSSSSAWTPRAVRVTSLRVGDLLLGPEGAGRRLATVRRTADGQYRLFVTDDQTGGSVPLNDRWDLTGVPGATTFVVLARDTPARAVRFGAARLFDGGLARSNRSTLRLRRGTAADWTAADPVLGPGEPGFEVDTLRLKIGDGGARWSDLPYTAGAAPDTDTGEPRMRSHFVGDDLTLRRPAYDGPVDWITAVDGVPDHIEKGDWITRVRTVAP